MSSDRQMKRGKAQSLYKYLPDSWIDFSVRGKDRKQYIARVDHWNSEKLDGINSKRLIRTVNHAIQSYAAQGAMGSSVNPISGFGAELTQENCDVLTPKVSDVERGIIAKISPLTFYCKKCKKVYQFNSEDSYNRNHRCKNCHIELTQFRQIYFCKCGYATDKHPRCLAHGFNDLYWDGEYNFTCRTCKKKISMQAKCPECGATLGAKVALDPSQFFTYSLSLIDLIDEKLERFISETDYGKYITIAFFLGKITRDQLDEVINKGITTDPAEYTREYDKNFQMFMGVFNDENTAANAAKAMTDKNCGNSFAPIIEEIKGKLYATSDNIDQLAEMILEHSMVKELKDHATLETAIKVAQSLNTNANPESFRDIAKRFGIKHVRACDKVPFVSCSYGYTRVKSEYEDGVQLHAFKEEKNGRKNIYATRMNTEGVLFEFDRLAILQWLVKNGFVDSGSVPDLNSEEDVKLWFINNIKPEEIHPFTTISEETSPETYYVYRLIHSISHLLIRAAADIGGLGKDSLSEYIFPGVPAVLIYVQNSQGFNLGSLFNTFEAYFDKWLLRANSSAQKCVFDPICIERHKACTGCLFLNEVSCQHFNKDLDRSLIIGHVYKQTKKRIIGFWEEE